MLDQGIKKQYVFLVCIICAVLDAVLIFAGVMGFGYLVYKFSYLEYIARYGGVAFLLFYAIKSFYTAYTMNHALILKELATPSLAKTAFLFAFTLLNSHVYLDWIGFSKFGADAYVFGLEP